MKAFQARKFPSTNITPAAASKTCSFESTDTQCEDFGEDDDGLGYYQDGVKRTLTDEQIAMFRHSEIYALLREQQVRKENRDADFDPPLESVLKADSENQPVKARTRKAEDEIVNNDHSNENEEYATFSENQATKIRAKGVNDELANNDGSDDEEEYARFLETEKRNAEAARSRKKRKMNNGDHDNRGRPVTHRRIARELDDVIVSEQAPLDYGEESSKPTIDSEKIALEDDICQLDEPKQTPHEPELSTEQKHYLPVEGRKIWWPIIGT